jgi:8-oxoguanine deaminase
MAVWIRDPHDILATDAAGGLVVDDGVIVECVPKGATPRPACAETFDASGHVVLPGLVNTHHHFYQNLTRALRPALDAEVFPWLSVMYPLWRHIEEDDLRLAARLALCELLMSGCTTAADHHYVFPPALSRAIDVVAEEARALGIRVMLTRGSMDLSVADGGLPPRSVVQSIDTILADSERLVAAWHDPRPDAMVRIALAPCSPFSVSGALMAESAALAARHGLGLHTHLAAHAGEVDYCLERFGRRPIDYVESLGWLGPRVWLAHGIFFEPGEMARLAAAGVGIAHCPGSNMITGSGTCPVPALEAAGCAVGLAVDGSAANDSSSLIGEARLAFLLQRHAHGVDRIGHRDALRWATEGGARCLGWNEIGAITPGTRADLALFRADVPACSGADDQLAALLRSAPRQADRVMIEGHWRVVDGVPCGVDLAALVAAHAAAARALRGRAGL